MNYGKVEEPSSSRSRRKSTARFAATSAILTVILSRSEREPSSSTVRVRPGWRQHQGIPLQSALHLAHQVRRLSRTNLPSDAAELARYLVGKTIVRKTG